MMALERHLRMVRTSPTRVEASASDLEDVGVTLVLFLVAAFPLASATAGIGRWGEGSLGLATLGVLLAGRELSARFVARWRSARRA